MDVLFNQPGTAVLEHRTPDHSSTLATFAVADDAASPSFIDAYRVLRTDPELEAERAELAAHLDRPPDKTLQFTGEMDMNGMDMGSTEMGSKDMTGMDVRSMGMGNGRGDETNELQGQDAQQMSRHADPAGMHHQGMGGAGGHSMHQAETDDGIEWRTRCRR